MNTVNHLEQDRKLNSFLLVPLANSFARDIRADYLTGINCYVTNITFSFFKSLLSDINGTVGAISF